MKGLTTVRETSENNWPRLTGTCWLFGENVSSVDITTRSTSAPKLLLAQNHLNCCRRDQQIAAQSIRYVIS